MGIQTMKRDQSLPMPPAASGSDRLIIVADGGLIGASTDQRKMLRQGKGLRGAGTTLQRTAGRAQARRASKAIPEGDRAAYQELYGESPPHLLLRSHQGHSRSVALRQAVDDVLGKQISNRLLRCLQHYLLDRSGMHLPTDFIKHTWEPGYWRANQTVANVLCSEIARVQASAVVMVHDCYLAPAMIRKRYPSVTLQQFIPLPWPEVLYWQFYLPHAMVQAIYQGLVSNDVLSFQTEWDAQNFLEGAHSMLNGADIDVRAGVITWQNGRTQVGTFPLSSAVAEERRLLSSAVGCASPALVSLKWLFEHGAGWSTRAAWSEGVVSKRRQCGRGATPPFPPHRPLPAST
jgi:trehalose 6-phosphate synthase